MEFRSSGPIVMDTSAIIAILLEERGYEALMARILGAELAVCGAPTLVETGMVLSRQSADQFAIRTSEFVGKFQVEIIAFREEHYRVALDAFARFGKGRHAAALNFGDCLSYAAAKVAGLPLLYVGGDFGKTDIESALT